MLAESAFRVNADFFNMVGWSQKAYNTEEMVIFCILCPYAGKYTHQHYTENAWTILNIMIINLIIWKSDNLKISKFQNLIISKYHNIKIWVFLNMYFRLFISKFKNIKLSSFIFQIILFQMFLYLFSLSMYDKTSELQVPNSKIYCRLVNICNYRENR